MERYIVQKAQQALEALATEEPLEDRLRAARMHFSFVTDDHFLRTAPAEVQEYSRQFETFQVESQGPKPHGQFARRLRLFLRRGAASVLKDKFLIYPRWK